MIEIVMSANVGDALQRQLLASDEEACAALLAQPVMRDDGLVRLLVREVISPQAGDYNGRSMVDVELTPAFVSAVAGKAATYGQSVIFVHSHPGDEPPAFSPTDDRGETVLASYLRARLGELPCAAIVISRGGWACRELGSERKARVVSLGEQRVVLTDSTSGEATAERFDRQVRAFGPEGQRQISQLRVAIVGLGGTGSLVAQQLTHLGVRDFLLIDPDSLETTNLNRVVGTTPADVGSLKVEVATRMIHTIHPDAVCKPVVGNIVHVRTARELTNVDVIFGCTDSHGSRAVLQQVSYQYLIPCFDMGTTIAAEHGQVQAIVGRAQLLAPGLPCFSCSGLLDPNEVRRDMMSPAERKLDPYILGHAEPAPAVISLNATVVSLAVTMFMSTVVHWPSVGRYVLYNATNSSLRRVSATPQPNCYCCSERGYLARGESVALAGRGD